MEKRSIRENRHSIPRQRENPNTNPNPSFSSTLLDAIYRSIDEGSREGEEYLILYRETMRKTRSSTAAVHGGGVGKDEEMANLRRACLIEKWMEKKVSEKVVVRMKSAEDFERKSRSERGGGCMFLNSSTTSSSDSSSGRGFSSSEAESNVYGNQRPKPIRTTVLVEPKKLNQHRRDDLHMFDTFPERNDQQKAKHQIGFVKTKSKAMKIYGDLKKVKQPISPGGRLASFINSLFTAGNAKKAKVSSCTGDEKNSDQSNQYSKPAAYSSMCSSASSFSRSCLSKTPSLGKPTNGVKRSVRFCPVSIIVGEDLQSCKQKSLYKDDPKLEVKTRNLPRDSIDGELKLHIMEKNRRVEEVARDLLKKVEPDFNMKNIEKFDDDGDDAASCASSDLFELDNLSAIGVQRYREEFPVYETTHLDTNRAIANGFVC